MGSCWTKEVDYDDDHHHEAELASGNVHLITTMEDWDVMLSEASKDGKIVLANFSAPWCNPCRSIAPTYIEMADKYPSFLFLTVNVDELTELSSSWGISATPTFFFLKEKKTIDKLVGANKEELHKKLALVTTHHDSQTTPN
ncbi:thioredoxin H-type-like [Cannabis sativa]|uniref:Thioredoxin domain-containing protein n=1 Tax=Cannabis sativa TaxID=3483 RepID=A0A803P0P3_CANSA|nr:thioredoxin H-type-like [Cannabis sativa]